MAGSLDVNADVGEGFPHDRALLDVITSANVACGFHAGDEATMRQICGWSVECGVALGAQVSYRDRDGFGRRVVEIGYDDLRADVAEQIDVLSLIAESEGCNVVYVKPHGALYNRAAWDGEQARAVVDAAAARRLPLLGLPGSSLLALAVASGVGCGREFFADRGYRGDGTLVPRSESGALVTDPVVVARRVGRLVETGTVTAADDSTVTVDADSVCVHGDTKGAVQLVQAVARVLAEHDIEIKACW